MSEHPDQKQRGTALAFQEELIQAIEIWNKTPVSILDQQAVHTHTRFCWQWENTSPIGKKKVS